MAKGSSIASKAAGKAKGAAKALAGYPGIFHHLAAEHGEVAAVMKRISKGDGEGRRELFRELRKNLLAHAHAEEQIFYTPLRAFPELAQLLAASERDHQEVEGYIDRLAAMDEASDEWTRLFERMKQAVENHVEREEQDLFPKAVDLLTNDQANEMLERYEPVEDREKARL